MNHEEFEKLSIDQKVFYVNDKLKSGLSMKTIAGGLNFNESTIRKQLNKGGYHNENGVYTKVNTDVIPKINKIDDLDKDEFITLYKTDPDLFLQTIGKNMNGILNRIIDIEKWIETKNTKVHTNAITVDIPNGEMKLISFRLNEAVYEKWKQFTNEQKVYRSQDLLAMALTEYMEKYQ
jgi:hypothetical protein